MPSSRPTRTTASPGWSICASERDRPAHRSRPPAARDRSVVPPDRRQPGHLHRGPGAGAAAARPRAARRPLSRRRVRAARRRRSAGGPHHLDRSGAPARSAVRPAAEAPYRQGRLRHRPARSRPRRSIACASALVDPDVRYGATVEPARREALRTLCWEAAQVELIDAAHGDGKHPPDPGRPGRDRPPSRRHQPQFAVAAAGRCPSAPSTAAAAGEAAPPIADDGALRRTQPQRDGLRLAVDAAARRHRPRRRSPRRARLHAAAAESDRARPAGASDEPGGAGIPGDEAALRPVHQLLVGRPAEEETVQMLCRVGYAPAQQHTPRRGVEAIVRS